MLYRVRCHTKPVLGARMLRRAWVAGVPMEWVTGDEVYGDDPRLRDVIARAVRCCVLAVEANTPVLTTPPATVEPKPAQGAWGRPPTRMRLAAGTPRASMVKTVSVHRRGSG